MRVLVWTVATLLVGTYACVFLTIIAPSPEHWFGSVFGLFHFIFISSLFGIICYSYYVAVTTPPGRIPPGWIPEGFTQEELEEAKQISSSQESSRKRNLDLFAPRFCSKCNQFKPPRSHHCSECDVCIPKMDHHCPWVNNCVGNGNHKVFVVFLFWMLCGLSYAMFLYGVKVVLLFISIAQDGVITVTPLQGVIITVNVCVLVPFWLGVISLFSWQIGLVTRNSTTVEYHGQRVAIREARKNKVPYRWPYDLGPVENIKLFFGRSPLNWCVPKSPETLSNGLSYPTSFDVRSAREEMRGRGDLIDV